MFFYLIISNLSIRKKLDEIYTNKFKKRNKISILFFYNFYYQKFQILNSYNYIKSFYPLYYNYLKYSTNIINSKIYHS